MNHTIGAHNPRAEARSLLPPGHDARVLEPSPPASTDPVWFADDPTDPGEAAGTVVTPIPGEGIAWAGLAEGDDRIALYATEHWLEGARPLVPPAGRFDTTRRALHQIAYFAMAPARYAATGRLGLRYTHRGFGTPFFGTGEQIRVENGTLVYQAGDTVQTEQVSTVGEAARFFGVDYSATWFEGFRDPLSPVGPHEPLDIDPGAAAALAGWFGFATHVLERARRTPGAVDVSRVQLWPEHFDPAFEMGSHEAGARASYGGSPGDDHHPEPYLYVAAWGDIDRADPYWNDHAFNGASLGYAELAAAGDPYQVALDFFARGHDRLNG